MKIYNLVTVYLGEIVIFHHTTLEFEGSVFDIPDELFNKEIVEIRTNYDSGGEYSWLEVYI